MGVSSWLLQKNPAPGLTCYHPLTSALSLMTTPSVLQLDFDYIGANIVVQHTCVCGSIVESTGHHGLSCRRSGGRILRHQSANETIRRALVSGGIPAVLEHSRVTQNAQIFFIDIYLQFCINLHRNCGCVERRCQGYYQKDWTKSVVGYGGVSIYRVSHPTFGHRRAERNHSFHHGNNSI